MATLPASTGLPPCAPFNPAVWLSRFESVGGGYVVTHALNLYMIVEGRSDEDVSTARQMIVDLADPERIAITSYLRGRA